MTRILILKAQRLYANDEVDLDLDEMVYIIDSTTIVLCLSLFPWAHFRQTKSTIKEHTQMQIQGSIPVLISISSGKVHDVNFLDEVEFEAGSIYVIDRGYVDFKRLFGIGQEKSDFPDQQLRAPYHHHREAFQEPLANRTLLQVDQTKLPNPQIFRKQHSVD